MVDHPHVTKKEAAAVVTYAVDVAEVLRLPGWLILVMPEPCSEGAHAEIDRVAGKWTARLWLAADWMQLDYDQRRETITHEVCHLMHAAVGDVVLIAHGQQPRRRR